MTTQEAFNILQLTDSFTKESLKSAYRKKCIEFHPDRNPNGEEMMKCINVAYDLLKKQNISHTHVGASSNSGSQQWNNYYNNLYAAMGGLGGLGGFSGLHEIYNKFYSNYYSTRNEPEIKKYQSEITIAIPRIDKLLGKNWIKNIFDIFKRDKITGTICALSGTLLTKKYLITVFYESKYSSIVLSSISVYEYCAKNWLIENCETKNISRHI